MTKMNPKLQTAMRQLNGSWFNPLPEQILDNKNEQINNIEELISEGISLGRGKMQVITISKMPHLCSDFSLFVQDQIMTLRPNVGSKYDVASDFKFESL